MSGVYIKGMQMPKGCKDCDLVLDLRASMLCPISGEFVDFEDTPETVECPLIPVPDHGRLIDADALITTFCEWGTRLERGRKLVITMSEGKQAIVDIIDDAPTIIPADKEGEK